MSLLRPVVVDRMKTNLENVMEAIQKNDREIHFKIREHDGGLELWLHARTYKIGQHLRTINIELRKLADQLMKRASKRALPDSDDSDEEDFPTAQQVFAANATCPPPGATGRFPPMLGGIRTSIDIDMSPMWNNMPPDIGLRTLRLTSTSLRRGSRRRSKRRAIQPWLYPGSSSLSSHLWLPTKSARSPWLAKGLRMPRSRRSECSSLTPLATLRLPKHPRADVAMAKFNLERTRTLSERYRAGRSDA